MGLFRPNIEKLKEKKDIEKLIKALFYDPDNYKEGFKIRRAAAEVLVSIRKPIIGPLMKRLEESDYLTEEALWVLGEIKDKQVVEFLVPHLNHYKETIQCATADALGKIKDKKAVRYLINALEEKNCKVLSAVIKALGNIKDVNAIDYIIPFLYHKDKNVMKTSMETIKKFGDKKGFNALKIFESLKESDNKKWGKGMALRWWRASGRGGSTCAWCKGEIDRNEGYLVKPKSLTMVFSEQPYLLEKPDLICEDCFKKNPDVEPYPEDLFDKIIRTID